MGMIRKMLSTSTAGLIDFRSDKERIARSSRRGAKQAKAQTRVLQKQLRAQRKLGR